MTMTENYQDFRRVFLEKGMFRKAVSCLVYHKMGTRDIYNIKADYALVKQSGGIDEMRLAMTPINDRYWHKMTKGVNPDCASRAIDEIDDMLMKISVSKGELLIKEVLTDFSKGMSALVPVWDDSLYREVYEYLIYDDHSEESDIIDFAYNAYMEYQLFMDGLEALCKKHKLKSLKKIISENGLFLPKPIQSQEEIKAQVIDRINELCNPKWPQNLGKDILLYIDGQKPGQKQMYALCLSIKQTYFSDKRGWMPILRYGYEYDSDFVKLICCDILGQYTDKYIKTHSNYKPHDADREGLKEHFPYLETSLLKSPS